MEEETTKIHESRLTASPEEYIKPANHVFRKAYRALNPEESLIMDATKDKAFALYQSFEKVRTDLDPAKLRALAIAKTKLEESVMWAVKAITG